MANSAEKQELEAPIHDEAHDSAFEQILQMVGDQGRFQNRFNYIFNFGLVIFTSMAYMNIILMRSDPDHWCHFPGREETNFTMDEWKRITLPREIDNRGISALSKCSMYDLSGVNASNLVEYGNSVNWSFAHHPKTVCKHGYDYDRTWYAETLTSQENWVCERQILSTDSLTYARIGEVIGTFIFGQLGDSLGRRKVLYAAIYTMIFGRLLSVIFTSNFLLHSLACVIGSLPATITFSSPLIILMETSNSERRANSAVMQNYGWVTGMVLMPLIFWVVRDWIWFTLITTLPAMVFLLFPKYLVESPRWLASKSKLGQAAKQLNKIAKINKIQSDVEINEEYLRQRLPEVKEDTGYGVLSLFTSVRLTCNVINLAICWSVAMVMYSTLVLYIANMDGNPFINFIYQSIVELPAFLVGRYFSDKIGRRFTNLASFSLSALCCLPGVYLVTRPELTELNMNITVFVKFCCSITFFAINLQGIELFPTCLRQTGMSVLMVVSGLVGTLGPFIVYLGETMDARIPYIMLGLLSLLAAVCGMCLPETLHQKLPETLEDAQVYGRDQKFWQLPKKPKDINENETEYKELKTMENGNIKNNVETEKLNEKEFTP